MKEKINALVNNECRCSKETHSATQRPESFWQNWWGSRFGQGSCEHKNEVTFVNRAIGCASIEHLPNELWHSENCLCHQIKVLIKQVWSARNGRLVPAADRFAKPRTLELMKRQAKEPLSRAMQKRILTLRSEWQERARRAYLVFRNRTAHRNDRSGQHSSLSS